MVMTRRMDPWRSTLRDETQWCNGQETPLRIVDFATGRPRVLVCGGPFADDHWRGRSVGGDGCGWDRAGAVGGAETPVRPRRPSGGVGDGAGDVGRVRRGDGMKWQDYVDRKRSRADHDSLGESLD